MLAEVASHNDAPMLRTSLRAALGVALSVRAPRWLVELLAGAAGELAALTVHQHDLETPLLLDRARSALRVWESWQRSQL